MSIGRKREHPDYKSYCLDKYALRCAKCALVELIGKSIENSSGIKRGDIQEQYGPFEACGYAAYKGWAVRFAGKRGFVDGALFFCFVFFWACKRK